MPPTNNMPSFLHSRSIPSTLPDDVLYRWTGIVFCVIAGIVLLAFGLWIHRHSVAGLWIDSRRRGEDTEAQQQHEQWEQPPTKEKKHQQDAGKSNEKQESCPGGLEFLINQDSERRHA
ncbi:hypothetical protein BJ741DRAFT_703186 [Chytriomyces cf. hyalinus JEL632]|nr:hypothetical protein BJ741DRAFT_703186 [Chytriomyces cf. hyalinus JEL632]